MLRHGKKELREGLSVLRSVVEKYSERGGEKKGREMNGAQKDLLGHVRASVGEGRRIGSFLNAIFSSTVQSGISTELSK